MSEDSDSDIVKAFFVGFLVALMIAILFGLVVADMSEQSKVRAGYLTFRNKTYTVTLYDTLDKPTKQEEEADR